MVEKLGLRGPELARNGDRSAARWEGTHARAGETDRRIVSLQRVRWKVGLVLGWLAILLAVAGAFAPMASAELPPANLLLNAGFELGVPPAPWEEDATRGRTLVVRGGSGGGGTLR